MRTVRIFHRIVITAIIASTLGACLSGSNDAADSFAIEFTSPSGVSEIQTPDIVINLSGKVMSETQIESVIWANDRGGRGTVTGKETWVTGNIVLQTGLNNITITAINSDGDSTSKSLAVDRENTSAPGPGTNITDSVAMYSYAADLSNAAPVKGALISPQQIYFFVVPGTQWSDRGISSVKYLCCRGISGPGSGTSHAPAARVTGNPWIYAVDLTGYEPNGVRRLSAFAVFNDGSESDRPIFDFTIANSQSASNRAPLISGSPQRIATVGNQYSFRPLGQDPDGDTLRFSISNKPAWAKFDETNGRLYGTPSANHVGTYDSIVISVSDGHTSSSLSAFTISVESFGNNAATLQWSTPTQRTDNSALTTLAGYNLYFGQVRGDYPNRIQISNAGVSTYVVDNLSSGNWYFIVTALDANGLESNPSNEVIRSF